MVYSAALLEIIIIIISKFGLSQSLTAALLGIMILIQSIFSNTNISSYFSSSRNKYKNLTLEGANNLKKFIAYMLVFNTISGNLMIGLYLKLVIWTLISIFLVFKDKMICAWILGKINKFIGFLEKDENK